HIPLLLFSFHASAPPAICTLSLHDALPISPNASCCTKAMFTGATDGSQLYEALTRMSSSLPAHWKFIPAPTRARRSTLGPFSTSDRKSTRLNSSHLGISYAVFCLKKKNKNN